MPTLSRTLATAALAAAMLAGTSTAQAQVAAITLTEAGPSFESAPYTLGFAFSVAQDLRLTALGVYDHGGDGLDAAAQVGLWLDGGNDALLLADVPGGDNAALQGLFRWAPVAPIVLQAGVVYLVGAYLDGGTATSFGIGSTGTATVDPRIQLLGDRFGDGFFNIIYPGESDGANGAWLGANFQLAPVPEPASAGLLMLGLAAMAWRRRRVGRSAGSGLRVFP